MKEENCCITLINGRIQDNWICLHKVFDSTLVVDIHFNFSQIFAVTRCLNEKSLRALAVVHYWVRSCNFLAKRRVA